MKTVALTLLALVAVAGTAQAQRVSNVTGGRLGNLCTSQDRNLVESCSAYLNGVADAISFYQHLQPADGSQGKLPAYVCVPNNTTGPQMRDAYVAWLRKHQEAQSETAAQASMRALHDSFQCPGQ